MLDMLKITKNKEVRFIFLRLGEERSDEAISSIGFAE